MDGYISRKQNSTTGYLFKNAHGDVLAAYSSTSNKLADYSYTAWGEQRSVNETSSFTNNPLRYCGEYYDCESGMTYLRARYYDSNIKRFISEDPIKDGLNWYSYAGNNPVMYVDPSGLELILQGTGDEVSYIWSKIKDLSHDKLVLTQLKDDNDNLIDKYSVTIEEEHDGACKSGTELIRRIVYNGNTVTVKNNYKNQFDATDCEVGFNPYYDPDVLTVDSNSGNMITSKRPQFIALAHELIHAERYIRGATLQGITDYTYVREIKNTTFGTIQISNTIYNTEVNVKKEELATIGLAYNQYNDITENIIRSEHGYGMRGAY